MTINELGKVVDYLYNLVKPKYPDLSPEDVYDVIYKLMKKNKVKDRKVADVINPNNLREDFIFNVKPRRYPTEPTPIVTALGIGHRIQKEIY